MQIFNSWLKNVTSLQFISLPRHYALCHVLGFPAAKLKCNQPFRSLFTFWRSLHLHAFRLIVIWHRRGTRGLLLKPCVRVLMQAWLPVRFSYRWPHPHPPFFSAGFTFTDAHLASPTQQPRPRRVHSSLVPSKEHAQAVGNICRSSLEPDHPR